jgi:hypothetical protein
MLNKNLIPLITGIAIITSPLVALAQFPQPQSAPPPQQQQSPVAQIESEAMNDILEILKPEQQVQYKRARRQGSGIVAGLEQVDNISEDQQKEIAKIIRRASQKIMDVTRPKK